MRNNISPLSLPFICSILLGLCTLAVSRECLGSQQSLLLQLKNSPDFDGEYSTKLVTWNESSDCCSWEGVTCEEGLVTHLDLSGEHIYGQLDNSSTLFNLQHLKSLDLSYNSFNSTIPSRIGNLTNLSLLNLAYAGFSGDVPVAISRLRSLVTLDLSSSDDSDETKLVIPNLKMLVQNLSKLQELRLDGSNISASGSGWCHALSSSLPNLRILSLSRCYVPGPLDESLVKLQSLSVVDLDGTNLSSPVPQSYAKLSNLTFLNLRNCGLLGTFHSGIFQIPTLQIIKISLNHFLQGTLPEFQINNSLQELHLSSTRFAGRLPESLGNLQNLSILQLSKCQFNGILPSSMSNLVQLVHVDLSRNNFTGSVPSFNLSKKLTSIYLSHNGLAGEIPLSLFSLPHLESILLSNNQFSGPILEFETTSSSSLYTLDLSHNNLEGLIPASIFKLGNLTVLYLSYNKFNVTVNPKMIPGSSNLGSLDLSYNSLKSFPDLKSLSGLLYLDLSNNQISGEIPKWILEAGNKSLSYLNLSHNNLVSVREPFVFLKHLEILDLHSNQLQGNIPVLPRNPYYLDFSSNNFTAFPHDYFRNMSGLLFFSLSNNSLAGDVSECICDVNITVLDLSLNNLSGRIPTCLLETSDSPEILNLGNNNFKGPIPDVFPSGCSLTALDLNGNFIEGEIPKSLANCFDLEVLDLGHNELIGEFPCLVKNLSSLRVLILRSNKLHGNIECLNANGSWPVLQIFDIAHNNFSGELPRRWLTKLQGMMADGDDPYSVVLSFAGPVTFAHYVYKVIVISKGIEMELPKILTIFTYIDLSRNNFHGPIPAEMGQLKALYSLNLSHNYLTGQIPPSIGNLRKLESLDLSWNNLSGTIPTQLQSLTFLELLNVSFNHLVGMIPTGSQLQTFSADSYIENEGLCGFPLTKNCSDKLPDPKEDNHSNSGRKIDWTLLSAEIGLLTGFAIVVAPLMFSRIWRIKYYERVDDIIIEILPLSVSRKWFLWTTP